MSRSGSNRMGRLLQIVHHRLQHFDGRYLVDRLDVVRIEHGIEDVLVELLCQDANTLDSAINFLELLQNPLLSVHAGKLPRIARRPSFAEDLKIKRVPYIAPEALDLLRES